MRVLLAIMLLAGAAFGQTISSVSGTVATGDTLTIVGSGFGSKSPVAPIVYEHFSEGSEDQTIEGNNTAGWYEEGVDDAPIVYSSDVLRDGSGFAMLVVYPDTIAGSELNDYLAIDWPEGRRVTLGEKAFASFHINSNYPGSNEPDPLYPQQWKIGQPFSHSGNANTWRPTMMHNWDGAGTTGKLRAENYRVDDVAGQVLIFRDGSTTWTKPDEWAWWQLEEEVKINSARGTADGVIDVWYDGINVGTNSSVEFMKDGDGLTYCYGASLFGRYIQGISDSQYSRYYVRFDDIYIDNSWARVALGNASTWSACTVREYQLPVYWASDGDSVQVEGFTGSFADDETAWVYLVTDAGAVSNGIQVTVSTEYGGGGEPEPTAPGAPSVNRGTGAISWSAAVPQPDHYTVWVFEDDILRHSGVPVDGADTGITLTLSETAVLRTYVVAYDANNSIQSTSGTTYTAAP